MGRERKRQKDGETKEVSSVVCQYEVLTREQKLVTSHSSPVTHHQSATCECVRHGSYLGKSSGGCPDFSGLCRKPERDRQRESETGTERQAERETGRESETGTERDRERETGRERQEQIGRAHV